MKKTYLILLVLWGILPLTGYAQEARFKALYMYNFIRYLEWPEERHQGDFVIGIYGSSPITQELKIIADKKQIGTQNIQIREIESTAELSACHILYVPENRSGKLDEITANCKTKGTVLITDKPGLGKTIAGINYVQNDGKQSFEINKSNLMKQGVKINSALLSLGIVIE